MDVAETVDRPVSAEDLQRAQLYRLLAKFLVRAPRRADLELAAALSGDDTPLGQAAGTLAKLAAAATPSALDDEFHDLFIGVGRGELVPYASYYLTGFLNEKPLARLRQDMNELGIVIRRDRPEPEDHIATVCEIMAGLIDGEFDRPRSLARQRRFFLAHVGSWAGYFFTDLQGAKASTFYAALGALGSIFIAIEQAAFEMVADDASGE